MKNWYFGSAVSIGMSHLKNEMPCQDKCAIDLIMDNLLIAVLSDGAGSAKNSEFGAEIAVNSIIQFLREQMYSFSLDEDFIKNCVTFSRNKIIDYSIDNNLELKSLACTLIILVSYDDMALIFQLGDGGCVLKRKDEDFFEYAIEPMNGEYINTTYFLTDDNYLINSQIKITKGIEKFAIFSDGIQKVCSNLSTNEIHQPFFQKLFSTFNILKEKPQFIINQSFQSFLDSDFLNERTDDDKSLLLLTYE